jgi:cell division protease FtsH
MVVMWRYQDNWQLVRRFFLMAQVKDKNDNSGNPFRRTRLNWWLFLLLLILILLVPYLRQLWRTPETITWTYFANTLMTRKAVEKLEVVNNERVYVYVKKEMAGDSSLLPYFKTKPGVALREGPHFSLEIGSVESFERRMDELQQAVPLEDRIPYSFVRQRNWIWEIVSWTFPFLLLFLIWRFFLGRMVGGRGTGGEGSPFTFGRSTAQLIEKQKSKITFDDVAGLEEAEMEVREIVEFLQHPENYTRLGAKIPKGVILVGPPGTGKTLLAKAVAGEADVPFFSISGSEFVEMFVGVGASRVRDLFKRAKEKAPCIVFIDEIDAIGRSRGKGAFFSGANDERESTLNQLLTEMDGFGTNTGVIVLAATNRADMLDPALLRPGRFDRHIYLELPNLREREEIFKVHMRPLVMDTDVDAALLAGQTPGFSGADIANICNEAALIAARNKKDKIGRVDFISAIDRIVAGMEKKSKIISSREKEIIAYHEAGHAVASWFLPGVDPLVKLSIIPRGKTLGAAWYLPEEKQLRSESVFADHICATLAGRASEELMFQETSSGALDDLEKATREAYMMVAYYGFNKRLGNISFYDSTGQRDPAWQRPYSEETARIIDEEVRLLIKHSYERALELLSQHREALVQLAQALLNREMLLQADLEAILGKRVRSALAK